MKLIVSFVLILSSFSAYCVSDTLTVYINFGQHTLVDGEVIQCKAFNSSATFEYGANLFQTTSDSFVIGITNNDTMAHVIQVGTDLNLNISPGNSSYSSLQLTKGNYKMSSSSMNQIYLGLYGWIAVEEASDKQYYWNIKEFQTSFNSTLVLGNEVDFSQYKPNYFMINGKSNPAIGADTLAKIVGEVGDTLYVNLLNSGNAVHSLHFHGYHFNVMHSNMQSHAIGWEKDTYGVLPKEILRIRIVPHQPGEYPIHDHNLVATTANNIYPSGMFTTMVITE
jgi:hypothetical protein